MAVVSEGQHFPSAPLTGHHVRQIIRHQRVANAEKFDKRVYEKVVGKREEKE